MGNTPNETLPRTKETSSIFISFPFTFFFFGFLSDFFNRPRNHYRRKVLTQQEFLDEMDSIVEQDWDESSDPDSLLEDSTSFGSDLDEDDVLEDEEIDTRPYDTEDMLMDEADNSIDCEDSAEEAEWELEAYP